MDNSITLNALTSSLLALYVDSGIEALIPPAELKAGLDDLFTEAMPLVGELAKADRKGIALAEAVRDDQAFPNLAHAHGFVADLLLLELPDELKDWIGRLVALASAQPERLENLSRMLMALAMACPNPSMRALGRFAVFETLCQAQRIRLREGEKPLHPEAVGLPANAVERVAEGELRAFESDPNLLSELLGVEDPLAVLVGSSRMTFAAWHDEVTDVVNLARNAASEGHARQEAVEAMMAGLRPAGPVLFRYREEGDGLAELRQRAIEVMDCLPPAEAVLFRAEYAPLFDEEQPATRQLKRRHPLLLGDLPDNTIDQRRKRGRKKWVELAQQSSEQRLAPWRGQTLVEILKTFKEEYPR